MILKKVVSTTIDQSVLSDLQKFIIRLTKENMYSDTPCFVHADTSYIRYISDLLNVANQYLEENEYSRSYTVLDPKALYNDDQVATLFDESRGVFHYPILFLTPDDVNSGLNELLQEGKWDGRPVSKNLRIVIVGNRNEVALSGDIVSRIRGLHSDDVSILCPVKESPFKTEDESIHRPEDDPNWLQVDTISNPLELAQLDYITYRNCMEGQDPSGQLVVVNSLGEYQMVMTTFPDATCVRCPAIQEVVPSEYLGNTEDPEGIYLFSSFMDVDAQVDAYLNGDYGQLNHKTIYLPSKLSSELYQRFSFSEQGWVMVINGDIWPIGDLKFFPIQTQSFDFQASPFRFPQGVTPKTGIMQMKKEFEHLRTQGVETDTSMAKACFDTVMTFMQEPAPLMILQGPPASGKDFITEHILTLLERMAPSRVVSAHVTASYETTLIKDLIALRAEHPSKQIILLVSELNLLSKEDLQELSVFVQLDGRIKVIGTQNSQSNHSGRFETDFLSCSSTELALNLEDMHMMGELYFSHTYAREYELLPKCFVSQLIKFVKLLEPYLEQTRSNLSGKRVLSFRQIKHMIDGYVRMIDGPFSDVVSLAELAESILGMYLGPQGLSKELADVLYSEAKIKELWEEYFYSAADASISNNVNLLTGVGYSLRPSPSMSYPVMEWETDDRDFQRFLLCSKPKILEAVIPCFPYREPMQAHYDQKKGGATNIYTVPSLSPGAVFVSKLDPSSSEMDEEEELFSEHTLTDELMAASYQYDSPCRFETFVEDPIFLFSSEGVQDVESYLEDELTWTPWGYINDTDKVDSFRQLSDKQILILRQILDLKGFDSLPPDRRGVVALLGLRQDANDGEILREVYNFFNEFIDADFKQIPFCPLLDDEESRYNVWSFINKTGVCRNQAPLVEIFLRACGFAVESVSNSVHVYNIVLLPNGRPVIFDLSYFISNLTKEGELWGQINDKIDALPQWFKETQFYLSHNYMRRNLHIQELSLVHQHIVYIRDVIEIFEDITMLFEEMPKNHPEILAMKTKLIDCPVSLEVLRKLFAEFKGVVDRHRPPEDRDDNSSGKEAEPAQKSKEVKKRPAIKKSTIPKCFSSRNVLEVLKTDPRKLNTYLDLITEQPDKIAESIANGVGRFLLSQFPSSSRQDIMIVQEGHLLARSALKFKGADGLMYNYVRITKPVPDNSVPALTDWVAENPKTLVLTESGLKAAGTLDGSERYLDLSPKQRFLLNKVFAENGCAKFQDPEALQLAVYK